MRIYQFLLAMLISLPLMAHASINIVAAENVYGEVAKQLGGDHVTVTNIINSPSQDPHLFNTNPSTAIAISHADIIIYSGADYDPWMQALLSIKTDKSKTVIEVAKLMQISSGSNPHIWYLPKTMPTFAQRLVNELIRLDPQHANDYNEHLKHFLADYQKIFAKISDLKNRYDKTPIISTEPIFTYLSDSIGLTMHAEAFQASIMNDVPPSVTDIKAFIDDLNERKVRVLIYNDQVVNPMTKRMLDLAKKNNIAIVGVTEMLPLDKTYIQWMLEQLNELEKALANSNART